MTDLESQSGRAPLRVVIAGGGVAAIEVTFTVPGAHRVIEALAAAYPGNEMLLGAGTVLGAAPPAQAMYLGNYNLHMPDRRDFHTWVFSAIAPCRNPDNSRRQDCINVLTIPQPIAKADYINADAVLVDGAYTKNEKGELVYQDRSKEQLDRIATLVRSAIGFDQKRGDQVEVVNLRFAEAPSVPPVAEPTGLLGMLQFTKDDVMNVIELGVMMLLGLVVGAALAAADCS
mgnify:CR=1 FL=1